MTHERTRLLIAEYNRERNEALLTLDEKRIRDVYRKWNGRDLPSDPDVFWGAVHKCITGIVALPIAFRRASRDYLAARGLYGLDDGEL